MKPNRGNKWRQTLVVILSLLLIVSMILGFVAIAFR